MVEKRRTAQQPPSVVYGAHWPDRQVPQGHRWEAYAVIYSPFDTEHIKVGLLSFRVRVAMVYVPAGR